MELPDFGQARPNIGQVWFTGGQLALLIGAQS
jgi:hypothetical protein